MFLLLQKNLNNYIIMFIIDSTTVILNSNYLKYINYFLFPLHFKYNLNLFFSMSFFSKRKLILKFHFIINNLFFLKYLVINNPIPCI
jgi:hypothetical protein